MVLAGAYAAWAIARRSARLLPRWFANRRGHRPYTVLALRLAGLACAYIALLGWASPSGIERPPARGRQIFFVVDVSASMNVADLRPSRLVKVKLELERAVTQLAGDQMGLIVFANYAYTLCPLTTDVPTLSTYLDMISTGQFVAQGSELRPALYEARRRFDDEALRSGDDADRARVVVLITDGEDHGGKFSSAIALLRDVGAVVVPVGVGTRAGGLVPELDAAGRPSGVRQAPGGGVARSARQDAALQKLADAFDQPYFILDAADDSFAPVVRHIERLPAAVLPSSAAARAADTYPLWTLLAIGCIGATLFLKPHRAPAPAGPTAA